MSIGTITRLNIDEVTQSFRLENNRLIRVSDKLRWDGIDCTEQHTVRVGSERVKTCRVIFALQNHQYPEGRTIMNDLGEMVQIEDSHLYRIISTRNNSNCFHQHPDGRPKEYTARYTNKQGKRINKSFKTLEGASEWVNRRIRMIWEKDLEAKGFYLWK